MQLRPWILLILVVGCAGRDPYRKLPEGERPFISAVDVFLDEEQIDAWVKTPDPLDRQRLAESYGVTSKYDRLSVEEKEAVSRGEVLVGMSKDAVLMSLGPPYRIRRQYETAIEDYVESYQYRYERTKRGEVFQSPPNSRSAYKNDVFERHVNFVREAVREVVEVDVP